MPTRLDWQAIYSLKIRWRVSAKAIIYRAHDLDLLDAVQNATGNRFLNQTGQSKVEKFDEKIPQEEPELLKTSIAAYLDEYEFTPAEFANQLGMTPSMVEQLVGAQTLRTNIV